MESPDRAAEALTTGSSATSRLRLLGYSAILTALAFSQATGRVVADSKFDLVDDPWGFLRRSLHLWDPQAAFGQIQNQAAGYLLPMGPFFGLWHSLAVPGWVVQRLWWAVLLNLAFFGVLALLRELRVGRPWTQVAAAAAYVLAPRMTSLLGATSIELWPGAVAPWVLLPLVIGTRRGSVVRAAALSALAVALCGGVNATAVSAVLPMGVLWILTRGPGPRRWRLLAAWAGLTVLTTLWWSVPLVLQGRYAAPFLDYIETASVTQSVTDLADSVLGTSNWAPYLSATTYRAGSSILTTPFLIWDAAAIAALGLLGVARHPHRRFLVLSLLTGLVLVGLGHTGDVQGWWAADRRDLLDAALSPLRNSHKYDVIVRLSLALGLAHALTLVRQPIAGVTARLATRAGKVLTVATVLALCGLAVPWVTGRIAPAGAFTAVPGYWSEVADYLERGGGDGTALVMPAASFGDYAWGSPHDDVMQPLARSRWAVRNAVPLAEPGNVTLMDRVTELLESGRGSDELAPILAEAGVSELVVRNDLDRLSTGAPDPAYVHAALADSPGLTRVRGFGPLVGDEPHRRAGDGTRVLQNEGMAGRYRAVEVFRVDAAVPGGQLLPTGASAMDEPGDGLPLTGDLAPASGGVVLTDGMRAREEAFQAVRRNQSQTQEAGTPPTGSRPESFRRILPDQERWQATAAWSGAAQVSVSSSRADPSAGPPFDRGAGAAAAVDGDRTTAWQSAGGPAGQWLQVDFAGPTDVGDLSLRVPSGAELVSSLRVEVDGSTTVLPAPVPGKEVTWHIGRDDVRRLRVTAESPGKADGWWGISELTIPGVSPRRFLRLPAPPDGTAVDEIRLTRDQGASPCPEVDGTVVCQPYLGTTGEDGERIDRLATLDAPAAYDATVGASLRRDPRLSRSLAARLGVGLRASGTAARDIAESPVAVLDGDPATTWRTASNARVHPSLRLRLPEQTVVDSLTLAVGEGAPVSAPSRVAISAPGQPRVIRTVDASGDVALPGWSTRRLRIQILDVRPAFTVTATSQTQLPPGISDLSVNGHSLVPPQLPDQCGTGPTLDLGGSRTETTVEGSLARALTGRALAVRPCGSATVALPAGPTRLTAEPGSFAVADTIDLVRQGSAAATAESIPVRRDGRDAPTEATLGDRDSATVLTIPQNFNAAWSATMDGHRLTPQRVDGWKQGWLVPAGAAAVVHFDVPSDTTYRAGLLVGAGGLLAVLGVALVAGRRVSVLPPLPDGRTGWPDVAVCVGALGLLGGWAGVALVVGAAALCSRLRDQGPVGPVAAVLVLLSALQRVADPSWTHWLAQGATLSACALVAGSLLANGPTSFSRRKGRSSQR